MAAAAPRHRRLPLLLLPSSSLPPPPRRAAAAGRRAAPAASASSAAAAPRSRTYSAAAAARGAPAATAAAAAARPRGRRPRPARPPRSGSAGAQHLRLPPVRPAEGPAAALCFEAGLALSNIYLFALGVNLPSLLDGRGKHLGAGFQSMRSSTKLKQWGLSLVKCHLHQPHLTS